MSRRVRNDLDEEIDQLDYRLRFRKPNDRKRKDLSDDEYSSKIKRNRTRHRETEYDES